MSRDIGHTGLRGTFLADVEIIYTEIESRWEDAIGKRPLADLRTGLARALTVYYGAGRPPLRPAL